MKMVLAKPGRRKGEVTLVIGEGSITRAAAKGKGTSAIGERRITRATAASAASAKGEGTSAIGEGRITRATTCNAAAAMLALGAAPAPQPPLLQQLPVQLPSLPLQQFLSHPVPIDWDLMLKQGEGAV